MKFIKGYTYSFHPEAGRYTDKEAFMSMRLLRERTGIDTVILLLGALQDTAHSEGIDYRGPHMQSDAELKEMIAFCRDSGLRVILKPFVNCRNGTWRAHINFFDIDIPHEPQWGNWFRNYTDYQLHYAAIAEETGCEMIIIGCEMVQAQRKSAQWREMVAKIREVYSGLLTYNCDKYTEEYVDWWDCLDVISSSGYYPICDWEKELDRIERVVRREKKPFFFAEAGCPSRDTSPMLPNAWDLPGAPDPEAQATYFRTLFEHCDKRPWVGGYAFWDWPSHLQPEEEAGRDVGYGVFGKPAAQVIVAYYGAKRREA